MERNGSQHALKTFEIPQQEYRVSNISIINSLKKAFNFVPGQNLRFRVKDFIGQTDLIEEWEVRTDIYNNSFLFCQRTNSKAYFKQDDGIHFFTFFEGSRNSLLYYFYLAAFKIVYGYYDDLKIKDTYPLNVIPATWLGIVQDFCAPFFQLIRSAYSMEYVNFEDDFEDSKVQLLSTASLMLRKKVKKEYQFEIFVEGNIIERFKVQTNKNAFEAKWVK